MKKMIVILCLAVGVMSGFSPPAGVKSGIHGTIDPAEGASKVTAISGADSVSGTPVAGKLSLPAKPGNWTLIVEAVKPYRSTSVENILVLESQSTDAGVIKLMAD